LHDKVRKLKYQYEQVTVVKMNKSPTDKETKNNSKLVEETRQGDQKQLRTGGRNKTMHATSFSHSGNSLLLRSRNLWKNSG